MLDFHASSLYNWHLEMIIDKEESGDVQSLNFFRDNIKFSIHCPAIIPIFNKLVTDRTIRVGIPTKAPAGFFQIGFWHKVGRTHLALQNAWVYSKLGRSKYFSNYLNFRAKNISKYKLLHSRVDPTQKVYRS